MKREPPNDAQLLAVVEASRAVRAMSRAVDAVRAAASGSVLFGLSAAARRAWLRQWTVARIRLVGVALITAAAVHLMLMWWQGPIAGWLWLIVPALAIAFGGLMALAPSRVGGEVRP